jgi:hypothetical protein
LKRHIQQQRDIKNIIAVLGAAIVCAGLIASVFLYYYSPTGRYLAGHTLLDPAVIERINDQEAHPKISRRTHFLFDRSEFSYFDPQSGQMRQQIVSLKDYQKFYNLVASEISLEYLSDNIKALFTITYPAVLSTKMRTIEASGTSSTTQMFQLIQFVKEDYFRIQLHEGRNQGEWVYFHRPQIYQDVMRLLAPQH